MKKLQEFTNLIELIVKARESSSNEMAALIEWEKDNGKLTPAEHKLVAEKVAEIWRNSKPGGNVDWHVHAALG